MEQVGHSTPSSPKDDSAWTEMMRAALLRQAAVNRATLEELKQHAAAVGKEPFNVNRALEFYYPNDLTDNEELIIHSIRGEEIDYYRSGAMTTEEWAIEREKIKSQGDW